MSRAGVRCSCCSAITTSEDLRLEGQAGRLATQLIAVVVELCGESHNNVPWQDDVPGIAGLTHRLEEQGFVVTHIDNGPNTSIFWARRQSC